MSMGTDTMRRRSVLSLLLPLLAGGAILLLASWEERAPRPVPPHLEPVVHVHAEPEPPVVVEPEEAEPVAEPPPPPLPPPDPAPVLKGSPDAEPAEVEEPKKLPFAAGRVFDSEGNAIEGALVLPRKLSAHRGQANPLGIINTDTLAGDALAASGEDGAFSVREVPDFCESLVFVKPGKSLTEFDDLSEDRAENQDLVIVLGDGWHLGGHVRDTGGRPIPIATVQAYDREHKNWLAVRAYTDEEGRYDFASLAGVPVELSAWALGYHRPKPSHRLVEPPTTRADLVLRRHLMIVDVADAITGDPPPEARAVVLDAADDVVVALLVPRQANEYCERVPGRLLADYPVKRSKGPRPKAIDIRVFAPGYKEVTERHVVQRGGEPPHLTIPLMPGQGDISLGGKVLNGPGAVIEIRALENLRAHAWWARKDKVLGQRAVAADGSFAISGLPAGSYRLLVSATGRGTVSRQVNVPDLQVEVVLEESASLDVAALTPEGAPVPEAWITLDLHTLMERREARADSDGVAHFENLTAGRGALMAAKLYKFDTQYLWRFPQHTEVTLVAGETVRAEVLVPQHVPTTIAVRDSAGRPQSDIGLRLMYVKPYCVFVSIKEEGNRVMGLHPVTDSEGNIVVDLLPGSYDAVMDGHPSGPLRRRFEVGLRPGEPVEFEVPCGTAAVFGRVLEQGPQRPIAGRPVSVWEMREDASRLGGTVIDAAGGYEIAGLPAGRVRLTFELRADADGELAVRTGDDGTVELSSPFPHAYAELDLRQGQRQRIDATVPRVRGVGAAQKSFEFSVRVTDEESSDPIARARVRAEARVGSLWVEAGEFETDGRGAGTGRLLASDRYRIRVHGPRSDQVPKYLSRRTEIVVRATHGAIDVELPRAPAED